MSQEAITSSLQSLSRSVKINRRLCFVFIASNLVLAIALVSLLISGLQLLKPLQQQAPTYLMRQAKNQVWQMHNSAEQQYDQLYANNANNPLLTLADELNLYQDRLQKEERYWHFTLDVYGKLLASLSRHLGGAEEWQYFKQQELQALMKSSQQRQQTLQQP
ncbi:hypothetical protein NO559_14035 [Dasania sp. GY-MA-18]|uniref:Uncharacterized protein n=1 Tax=Dasania phycosphaerae TaxID=2950436 RepID=A0A9J6RP91_9GAMM|nr:MULTISPECIES: hypothetical protein [Dasania]MCR8923898.1 hypothetical protein [Dasania sp. GY-MA-18]MCZ0866332.1 hypothetical protein [Dasania phycosphaerae]MCZ0870056.1 hypothetical protein [Dasania phycosphaerae]